MSKEIEVVLVKDVKGLGKFGQTKKVRLGFARNYLLPYEFAILSTPANQLRLASLRKREEKRVAQEKAESESLAQQVNGKQITIRATAQDGGSLYGSVSASDIAEAIQSEYKVAIDRHTIQLEENIKEAGEYTVTIELPQDVTASVSVTVIGEVKETAKSKKSK
ncbi:50S ribosomal protein L9 [bacterium]|nr:50S ribosomal protein L9 [bacterium]